MPVIDLDDLVTGRLEPFGGWRVFDPPPPQPEMAVEEFLQRPAIVGSDNDVDRRAAGRARIHLLADPGFVVAVQAVADFTPDGACNRSRRHTRLRTRRRALSSRSYRRAMAPARARGRRGSNAWD